MGGRCSFHLELLEAADRLPHFVLVEVAHVEAAEHEGDRAVDLEATLLREGLVTRADHAAYLGRELTRAQTALETGRQYVKDGAPEPPRSVDPDSGLEGDGDGGCRPAKEPW